MQTIERDTIHRIADIITVKNYDKNAELSKAYGFSAFVFEFCKGDEELEQKLFDENDEITGIIYGAMKANNVEIFED